MIKDGRPHETRNLFYGAFLSFEQLEMIKKLLIIVGKNMFVDRDVINKINGEKIGLSYINKAVKYSLITQIVDKESRNSTDDDSIENKKILLSTWCGRLCSSSGVRYFT